MKSMTEESFKPLLSVSHVMSRYFIHNLHSSSDQRLGSCASLGSQMDCPMTILPVSRNQHSQARLSSSRSSLPQVTPAAAAVPPPSGGAGPGPFTSQYMVSHLQDLAAAVRDEGMCV